MSRTNRRTRTKLPSEKDVAKVVHAVEAGKAIVLQHLESVTKDERRRMVRQPTHSQGIVELVADLADREKVTWPGIDTQDMRDDLELAARIRPIAAALAGFNRLVLDTIFAASSRTWSGTTKFYSNLGKRAESDPVLQDSLKPATDFFAKYGRRRKSRKAPPSPAAPGTPGAPGT